MARDPELADMVAERNLLIVRRVRIGLGAVLVGVMTSVIGDHASMTRPAWADAMDGIAFGLVLIGFWSFSRPAIRARPVPLVLLVVALTCGMRVLGLSTITNVARPDAPNIVSAQEVVDVATAALPKVRAIVEGIVRG